MVMLNCITFTFELFLFHWWVITFQRWFNEVAPEWVIPCKSQILLLKFNLIRLGLLVQSQQDSAGNLAVQSDCLIPWHIIVPDHFHILLLIGIISAASTGQRKTKHPPYLHRAQTHTRTHIHRSIGIEITFCFGGLRAVAPIRKLATLHGNRSPGWCYKEPGFSSP